MTSSVSQSQEVVTCDLCSEATHQFCNDCQVGLCVDCVGHHVNKWKSLTHDMVPYDERKSQLVLSPCPTHPGHRCEAHCQQCDVHVCVKCILGTHKSHPVFEMADVVQRKKEEIAKENEHIESVIIPKYKKEKDDSKMKISESEVRCAELKKEVESQRELWHHEVDEIFDKVFTKIKFMTDKHIAALKIHQSKLRSMIPNIYHTIEQNKEILKTKHTSTVTDHKSKLHEFQEIPPVIGITIHELTTVTDKGRELMIELGDYRASLTQMTLPNTEEEDTAAGNLTELSEKATVLRNIATDLQNMRGLECVGTNEAWINGEDKMIRRVDVDGTVKESVTSTCPIAPNDIAVTKQGELLYCDGRNRAVNVVRNGRSEVLLTTPLGWHPDGLCCTSSGDVLVSLGTTDFKCRKIICYDYEDKNVKTEIEEDEDGNRIFKGGEFALYVAENKNGDVCAADQNADVVVAVDISGRVRFRYDGLSVEGIDNFSPRQITTDSLSQIIVTDALNHCLHILDSRGQMLGYIEDDSLLNPRGLSLDSAGRLWVGLSSGDIKIIQYLQ